MIDEKKIEAAAKHYAEENSMSIEDQMGDMYDGIEELSDAYKAGAKWAINEFLKGLWHHADEEPKKNRSVLTDTQSIMDKGRICWLTVKLTENGFVRNWSNYAKVTKITRWLYIDDLFPKKGGEE
jgi:hypothetical protein